MEDRQIEEQLLEGCRRLAGKGILNSPADSLSLRVPGRTEMVMISGCRDWREAALSDVRPTHVSAEDKLSALHASIYRNRGDVGAIAISSPEWVRLLANSGGALPPIFDEQVRHIGQAGSLKRAEGISAEAVNDAFSKGGNAALLDEQLLCLGMTCDRVLFNTELYEKCARAYVIAKASGIWIGRIPLWVRLIADRRLLKDEEAASASYRAGRTPDEITAY